MEGVKTIEAARIRAQGIKLQPTAALPAADANRCADLLYALADELEAARKEIAELSTHCEMLKNTGAQLEANICDRYESRRRELKDALAAERARAEKAEQSLKISEEVEIHATAQRHQTLDLLEERIARLTERAEKAERERDEVLQEERERHAGTRARVEALEAYAREVETVAAAIIETGQREKYAGIDALIARAETLISEHGATVSPYYCAETSARNCPRHQNGGEKGKE